MSPYPQPCPVPQATPQIGGRQQGDADVSVGGTVIDVEIAPDRVWVNTRRGAYLGDTGRWVRAERTTCAVFVERDARSEMIEPGDSLWWQGSWAMWTPKAGGQSEIRLNRIGASGVPRPSITRLCADASK